MQNIVSAYLQKFKQDRTAHRRYLALVLALAMLVSLAVSWRLKLTGISKTNTAVCGLEEHTHTDACYQMVLTCGLQEGELEPASADPAAAQADAAADTDGADRPAPLAEPQADAADSAPAESAPQAPADSVPADSAAQPAADSAAQAEQPAASQPQAAGVPHVHTDACYSRVLVCTIPEHVHTVDCYPNDQADLETEADWTATLPELPQGADWSQAVVAVAQSQLDYAESSTNWQLAEDGVTRQGYTRYGAWYGNPYGDWSGMFAAFCLHYAGVQEEYFTSESAAGAYAWSQALAQQGLYQPSSAIPAPGDVIFLTTAQALQALAEGETAQPTISAILETTQLDENGAVLLNLILGDQEGRVARTQLPLADAAVLGFADTSAAYQLWLANQAELPQATPLATAETATAETALTPETAETALPTPDPMAVALTRETAESADEGFAAGTLVFEQPGDYTVTLQYTAQAHIPQNAVLAVSEYDPTSEEYAQRYARALAALSSPEAQVYSARLFDIKIMAEDQELEPAAPVQVHIAYAQAQPTAQDASLNVVHLKEDGETELLPGDATQTTEGLTEVEYTAPSFSDYLVMLSDATQVVAEVDAENATPLVNEEYNYIETVTVQKLNGQVWENATDFTEGDSVRVNVAYSVPDGVVTLENPTVSYQLPNGITLKEGQSGSVTNSAGETVGSYTISTDGLVLITFDEAFIGKGNGFSGTVQCEGTMSAVSGEESGTIQFPGSSTTITVTNKNENDLKIEKSGVIKKNPTKTEKGEVEYTIKVSSTGGYSESITITDEYKQQDGASVTYKTKADGTLDCTIKDGNGNDVSDNYTVTLNNSANPPTFTVTEKVGTTGLAAGESLVIKYTVLPQITSNNGKFTIENDAAVEGTSWHDNDKIDYNPVIKKTGQYDATYDTITWTIEINALDREERRINLNGYTLTDVLPSWVTSVTNISLTKTSGSSNVTTPEVTDTVTNGIHTLSCTFPNEDNTNRYKLTFTTNAPADGTSTVTNEAELKGPSENSSGDYTGSSGDVTINHRTPTISKTKASTENTETGRKITWSTDVTLPYTEIPTSVGLRDVIYNAYAGDYSSNATAVSSSETENTHYGIKSEIENKIKQTLSLVGGTKTYTYQELIDAGYTIDIHYYEYTGSNSEIRSTVGNKDKTNEDVKQNFGEEITDDTGHVRIFTIDITAPDGKPIDAAKISYQYVTQADYSKIDAVGQWTFINRVVWVGTNACDAYDSYNKLDNLKKVSYDPAKGNEPGNSTETITFDKENPYIYYRIFLMTQASETEPIKLIDKLPEGVTFDPESVNLGWTNEEAYRLQNTYNVYNDYAGYSLNATNNCKTNYDGANNQVTFEINGYNPTTPGQVQYMVLRYRVRIDDGAIWDDITVTNHVYNNSITWEGHNTADSTVTVNKDRNEDVVEKSGQQKKDADGNLLSEITYTIDINSGGRDLIPDSDTIELVDTLTNYESASTTVSFELDSVKVYEINADGSKGGELNKNRYEAKYDAATKKLTLVLPDGLHMLLEYSYRYQSNHQMPTFSNSVTVTGGWATSDETKLDNTSSSATADKGELDIYKVDADNYQLHLQGAAFRLEKYDSDASQYVVLENSITTNEDGLIQLQLKNTAHPQGTLAVDTLYRLTEISAPDGYEIAQKETYLIWKNVSETDAVAFANTAKPSDVNSTSTVIFVPYAGGEIYIENTYASIQVNKVWLNADGYDIQVSNEIQVQLQRSTRTLDACQVKIEYYYTAWNGAYVHREGSDQTLTIAKGSKIEASLSWDAFQGVFKNTAGGTQYGTISTDGKSYVSDSIDEDCTICINSGNEFPATVTSTPASTYTKGETVDVGAPVTLNAANNWSYTWKNLEAAAQDGTEYAYTVKELTGLSDYEVSYSNNDGILSGKITITNKKTDSYELPETGGVGDVPFTAGGLALMAGSLLCGYSSYHRKKGRGRQL